MYTCCISLSLILTYVKSKLLTFGADKWSQCWSVKNRSWSCKQKWVNPHRRSTIKLLQIESSQQTSACYSQIEKLPIFHLQDIIIFKHTHFNVRLQVKRMAALADRWILTQLVVAAAVCHHSSPLISVMGLHLSTMFWIVFNAVIWLLSECTYIQSLLFISVKS